MNDTNIVYEGNNAWFNGVKYCKISSNGYFSTAINNKTHYLHRDVWTFYNGEIPPNHHIHHLISKNNNEIHELACVPSSWHKSHHMTERWSMTEPEETTCIQCGKVFLSVCNARFCSEKCNKRYVYLNEETTLVCKKCGKEFIHHKHKTKDFCSRKCMLENYVSHCKQCFNEFLSVIPNQKFCSKQCREKFRHQQQTLAERTKTCPHCGKAFIGVRTDQVYCCNICAQVERTKKYRAKKQLQITL